MSAVWKNILLTWKRYHWKRRTAQFGLIRRTAPWLSPFYDTQYVLRTYYVHVYNLSIYSNFDIYGKMKYILGNYTCILLYIRSAYR